MTTILQQSTSLCDTKYKIVFLGDMGVGKTSVIQRFVKDQFDLYSNPTVGIDFLTRNISFQSNFVLILDKTFRLQLWDTAGQQKYKSLVPAYLRDANCAVFVFDFTRSQTFDNLQNWIQIYRDHCSQNSIGFILGKQFIDLSNIFRQKFHQISKGNKYQTIQLQKHRKINQNSSSIKNDLQIYAQQYAKKQNMIFKKVSAKTGNGVLMSFQSIILQLQKDKNDSSKIQQDDQTKLQNSVLEKFKKLRINRDNIQKSYNCCYI